MPSTKKVGTPGPANDKIGGVPTLHYFDFFSKGRGQVMRLFWEDAEIAYEDIRYTFSEFPQHKSKISDMNPTASVPVIELNGRILTQSYAVLRRMARQLGAYDGETEEEKYWADAMCDVAIDWRTLFVIAFLSPDKETAYPKHKETDRKRYLGALERHLSSHEASVRGPYVLGDKVSYADFVVYQICHDEELTKNGREGMREYPRLVKLVDAMEERPNVKGFLESDRYLG
ncbi:hypothetical protein W97_06683 [Coniosporium apollinis CBS 100218]|uniref:Glutathione S-transferase n=1 Tax=Coniosporium apollinis (strain CBS 100218) TaxID=1168221 RepID=R7YZP2_CONA1|nr:uncharacterized protein W97_06683 [Coniosporium apollinis CBS 100218]EON67430.1 hypothetical protein W97_06683 [Coniosporium apollinis CBS 100218]